ncbi:hypothetical protein F0562_020276 [Nyssa sinensis]|uniref:Uncharacterized protein n=1 Tax=Nyssa sinensis TaxID=561372 RepID=A0A5J5BV85_9ASTE|nr:hypothetical protein F0562_020276 [Nyssa sinensis]
MATNNGAARSRIVITYKECQRNYAAPVMRYVVDGCAYHRREELKLPVRCRPPSRLSLIRHPVVPPPPASSAKPQSEPSPDAERGARGAPANPSPDEVRSEPPDLGEIEEKVGTKKKE